VGLGQFNGSRQRFAAFCCGNENARHGRAMGGGRAAVRGGIAQHLLMQRNQPIIKPSAGRLCLHEQPHP
jgi:hypothetical protein